MDYYRIFGALLASLLISRFGVCSASSLQIASYNVWGLPGFMLRHPERFDRLPAELNSLDADIVLIQEAFHSRASSLASLPRFPYFAWGPSSGFGRHGSGLLILSRFPILETSEIVYRDCGGFDCFANKGAQFAQILVPDAGIIAVFNTHLNANSHSRVRSLQATQLLKFVRKYSNGMPTVVGGDLNDDGSSIRASIRNFPSLNESTRAGDTCDPEKNPFLNKGNRARRIDHIFFANGFRGGFRNAQDRVTWTILKERLAFDGTREPILSDHFGVLSTVRLARSRTASRATVGSESTD